MISTKFWLHALITFAGFSLIYNPTGWCFIGDSAATGSGADTAFWLMAAGVFVFALFYGFAIADAITDAGKKFAVHGTIISVAFLVLVYLAIATGHFTIDRWEDAAWVLMFLASFIAADAKMEVEKGG